MFPLAPCLVSFPCFSTAPSRFLSIVSRGNSVEISWFGPNKQNQPKAKRQKYKRARPPGEGEREDPLRPHSPGETSAGPSTPSEAVEPGGAGGDEGRQRRKRHQQRGKRPYRSSHNARETSKRANQGRSGPWVLGRRGVSPQRVYSSVCASECREVVWGVQCGVH